MESLQYELEVCMVVWTSVDGKAPEGDRSSADEKGVKKASLKRGQSMQTIRERFRNKQK